MGNFYAGSTIIKGGKFASHDPADDGVGYTARKKSTASQSPKKPIKPSTRKVLANPKKLLESARKSLLHFIIDQILLGREEIKIPRNTHTHLQDALQAADTPIAWASSQKEFDALQKKKLKQRTERELRRKHGQQTTSVSVEAKRKKTLTTIPQPATASKPIPTEDDINKSNRMSLIRSLVSQMIKKQGTLTIPNLDSRLLEEVKAEGSLLLWLQAQPHYEAIFKALYLANQKATAPAPKKTSQLSRKKRKGRKQSLVTDRVQSQKKTAKGETKKKRVKQYRDPYEKPTQPVKPLSDAPVSYILKQLNKTSNDTLNPRKIDWDVT